MLYLYNAQGKGHCFQSFHVVKMF